MRLPRSERTGVVLLFDVYAAALPFVWARLTAKPVFYYAQDLGKLVAKSLGDSRTPGRHLYRIVRLPLEWVLLSGSTVVVTVTDEMSQALALRGIPRSRLETCSMKRQAPVIDEESIGQWQARLGTKTATGIVFVGNLAYPPNRTAADFIAHTLLPSCAQLGDRATFVLVGKGTEAYRVSGNPRLVGLGPVSDLDGLLHACHIGIAPVEVAGGISGKMVDYLLHGLRAVATPEAASGLPGSEKLTVATLDAFPGVLSRVAAASDPAVPGWKAGIPPEVSERFLGAADVERLARRIVSCVTDASSARLGSVRLLQ
jgi:Glycosyl transferases group 1